MWPITYCLRETGTITQGPNAGMVLQGAIQMCPGCDDRIDSARELAARHRALEPYMEIEIVKRQYVSRPKRHFKYETVEVYP